MKKKMFILIMVSFIVMIVFSQSVYALTVYCTDEQFANGTNGCKDTYTVRGGGSRDCTDDDYPTNKFGCKKTYDVFVFDTNVKTMNCTDADYETGKYDCKDTYQFHDRRSGKYQTRECTDDEYPTNKYGCKDTYYIEGDGSEADENSTPSNQIYDWWSAAGDFFNGASATSNQAVTNLVEIIRFAGNMIFVAATVFLGVKYIWGGVDAKADVKDSLVSLTVAAIFFYGYETISSMFMYGGGSLHFINPDSFENTALRVYSTILFVCNFLALGGLVYIGVKYLMAGAEGKASLKARGVPIVLGIIMVYATITFLNFIVGIL